MTFIVIPHGELTTRSFEVRYSTLRWIIVGAGAGLLVMVLMVGSWAFLAREAMRMASIQQERDRYRAQVDQQKELARELDRVTQQYEKIRSYMGVQLSADSARSERESRDVALISDPRPTAWPLVTSGFIVRTGQTASTSGVDIAIPADTYVRAAGDGAISDVGTDDSLGLYIRVTHGAGYESTYGHLDQAFVAIGDSIRRHEVIGLTGKSGRAPSPQLFFAIKRNGRAVDPLQLISQPR